MPHLRPRSFAVAVPIAAAIVLVCWSLFRPYPLWGHSSGLDMARLFELDRGLRGGYLYPRWAADMYDGYGSPLLSLYAPWGYYVAWPFHALGFTQTTAMKMSYALAVAFAALGMYRLVRRTAGEAAGVACAVAYVLAPYFLADLFARAAIAELWGFAIVPWVFEGLIRFADDGDATALGPTALGVGVLGFTHNISFLLYVPTIGLFILMRVPRRRWIAAGGAVAAGMAIGAFFWLPALALKDAVQSEKHLTTGFFSFARHFVPAVDLVRPHWGYGAPGGEDGGGMSRQLGLLHWAGLLVGVATAWRRPETRRTLGPFVVLTFVGLLFTNRVTQPLWAHLPLIRFVQFPWRFLMLATFASTVLLAAPFLLPWSQEGVRRLRMAAVVAGLAVLLYRPYAEARYLLLDLDSLQYRIFDADESSTAIANPRMVDFEDFMTVPNVRHANMMGMASHDFLPVAVKRLPTSPAEQPFSVIAGDGTVNGSETGFCRYEATVHAKQPVQLALEVFDFPGWSVEIDGQDVTHSTRAELGTVVIDVPPGDHDVRVRYTGAPIHKAANAFSLLSFLGVVGAWAAIRRHGNPSLNS